MATLRVGEAQAAARFLGIEEDFYDRLPDDSLTIAHASIIGATVASLAQKYDITALATPGSDGFCGHDDHIVAHLGALDAQARLSDQGIDIPVLALRSDGQGEARVAVNASGKQRALSIHRSQMPVDSRGMLDAKFFAAHPKYRSLFEYETYDVILPQAIGAAATRHAVAA